MNEQMAQTESGSLDPSLQQSEQFWDILHNKKIHTVYQPIVSLNDAGVLGYEALTRGPKQGFFASPLSLFQYAETAGVLYQLERIAREKAIQGAGFDDRRQMLFLNISASILQDPRFVPGQTLELLQARGLSPSNVVLELTERSSIEDFSLAQRVLEHYRNQGYKIAIDDAGAGYSSLQAIAELNPDYIKVDRSLIHSIHTNKTKEYIVETLVTFAGKLNIQIIAEGIEDAEELVKLTRMGVHFGQGYYLGRPNDMFVRLHDDHSHMILQHRKVDDGMGSWSIGELRTPARCFSVKAPISEVAGYFKMNVSATGAVVLDGEQPVGLIMRERLFQQLAGQYGFSLFWNRPIDQVMDKQPLIVDCGMPVEQVSLQATSRDINNLYDLVIIADKGKMAGVASIRSILECITNARMESAKMASPLTGLPGNIPIHRELNKRLGTGESFTVIYADLDYFKWFNDRYGFKKGDQLIQFTADVLQQAITVCGNPYDFVGHVGGDDFIVMSGTAGPEALCKEMIRRFDAGVSMFYDPEDWTYVEDRSGKKLDSEGVTISLSVVICECRTPVTMDQISQAAARLKKQSKSKQGSVYFMGNLGSNGDGRAAGGVAALT
ncbi:bifunctional diguanylate cyclase/phosphodiesterase [Paenibacillus thalictri]|uniref:GGDEF domain-containing protein n=1 Tax=Paenibacillus thalictri TaxID=2527873 RepID=A0A4V2J3U1_9BACL|nr:bifunctional diguanylate cyclase/phosphodiesterase [Paenibacillus thalictri]TBL75604.1 GGDEF domain-containing protein [Paenibacillus thalictri]